MTLMATSTAARRTVYLATLLTLPLLGALASCGPRGEKGGDTTPDDPSPGGRKSTAQLLGELHDAAGCATPQTPPRVWCVAADGWATGTAAAWAPGTHLLAGVAVGLLDEESVGEMLESNVTFAALGVADGKAKIIDIEPKSARDQEVVDASIGELAAVFKGKKPAAQLDEQMKSYLASLPAAADRPLVKGPSGWTLEGAPLATELRKVGDYWVSVETPPEEPYGILVTIFTDKLD